MKMLNLQRSVLRSLILIFGLLLIGPSLSASEVTYFALQREGQASIAIDERKKAAYIVDLGRGGDGDQMKLDNVPILDKLEQLGIEDLFFVCSHPHSDHMGGIRALFKQPRVFFRDEKWSIARFKSISVIDDGVSDRLDLLLQRSLGNNTLIKVNHYPAANKNAFAGISVRGDDVYMETIPYQVTGKPGPHGRAVFTYIELGENHILDPDDADSNAIEKVAAILKARGIRVTTLVAPHHASRYHNVAPLLGLGVKYAVIPVNPENRYGHPSPPILLKLMQVLGKTNVVFTGSTENVVLNEKGIKSALYTAANRDSYPMFVAHNRIRAEKKGNKEDIRDCALIQKMMNEDGGDSQSSGGNNPNPSPTGPGRGGAARRLFDEEVKLNGSILQPDFEFGAVSYGSDSIAALQSHKIFAHPLSTSKDLTGQDVAVILERANTDAGETPAKLTPSEARSVIQQLKMLGNNADKAKAVYVYFSSPTGFRNVLEPVLVTQPQELVSLLTPPKPSPVRPPSPHARRRPSRPQGAQGGTPPAGPQSGGYVPPPERLPRGGMVFLRGDKLFPVGEASELLGGTLDVCGLKYCVKTSGGGISPENIYELPFSPGPLFSEVWTRVYDNRIDSFYLSINPTKQFLRNLDSGLERIPSDRLNFGTGIPGTGIRTHEVVTAGNIEDSLIGQILWEADVAFKSQSLGFNVLTGNRGELAGSASSALAQQESSMDAVSLQVPYRERWCRLYWTSGSQSVEVDEATNKVLFKGSAVIARSEPMTMRNGDLVDEPRGTWCAETKSVAAALQRQANSGRARLAVLNQLRNLAEIQSFIRWARDNGITPTDTFRKSITQYSSAPHDEVPNWTSGIKTEPRVRVQQQRGLNSGRYTNLLHVSLADYATLTNCVLPKWITHDYEFPANGIYKDEKGVWRIPPDKYQFVDDWMAGLAVKIADCSNGTVLRATSTGRNGEAGDTHQALTEFGIELHVQGIHMHGGVLLGIQRGFLESAWRDRGLLLSPHRRPFFQRDGGKLHFWNFSDGHQSFGSVGQHVFISDGVVTGVLAGEGHLMFIVETKPGAIVRQELRVGHANGFNKGLEWAEARHGSDDSLIWNKAAWPCARHEASSSGCVQVSDLSLDALWGMIGKVKGKQPPISIIRDSENSWFVAVNLSEVRAELDQRWEKTPSSELNSRLALVYEYAKWGFTDEAVKRYREIASKIEGNTEDTILLKQLETPSEDK